jgi:hypothetical protein
MLEKTTLDSLTANSVSVKRQNYVLVEGVEYSVGEDAHRVAYVNSVQGRAAVMAELSPEQQEAIFAIWGSEPTVDENDSQ